MTFFARCAAVQSKQTVDPVMDHTSDIRAVKGSSVASLRKGQKVTSKSGKVFTVKEFDDVWCWTTDLALPWLRSELT